MHIDSSTYFDRVDESYLFTYVWACTRILKSRYWAVKYLARSFYSVSEDSQKGIQNQGCENEFL